MLEAHLKNYNFKYINDFISAFRIHSESITGMGKNKKAVILQQSLYFKRVKGRKINMFDKILIFVNYIVIRIQRIHNKVKAIFQKKVTVISYWSWSLRSMRRLTPACRFVVGFMGRTQK